jgi:hypothetical protein
MLSQIAHKHLKKGRPRRRRRHMRPNGRIIFMSAHILSTFFANLNSSFERNSNNNSFFQGAFVEIND